ncbi:hypothetical protein EB796_016898 [Bugula neritina]|uniref:Cyclic nucleotide-binding domain-containing protein n=1 Tax=Bugula neritina TaxID=10212 RepID=A0A7J7JGN3_BUGNE|nr:hypothetical protein EB796_016898 [Bugula neritina]
MLPSCHCWFEPTSRVSYWWSFTVCMCVLYNYWVIVFRYAFDEIRSDTLVRWFVLDYTADFIYLMDIVIGLRTAYLEEGVLQTNTRKMRMHYKNTMTFYSDLLCLLPLDFVYLSISYNSLLRAARLIKIYRLWTFIDTTERHTNYPNLVRTLSMIHYLFLIFHWNASFFYVVMKDSSVFNNEIYNRNTAQVGHTYLHSLYWSVLSLSTISHLPHPRRPLEYVYNITTMIAALLLFAAIMGMVAHIVSSMHFARKEFQARLDDIKTYMAQSNVPRDLQQRVIRWFDYLWKMKKSVNKSDTFDLLPDRLRTDIAIHIHLDTLSKVEIFQNTEAGFLKELVLRLEPVLFSPNDLVCRKGEVGKEMYIVKKGVLHVVDDNGHVLATLTPGCYFGEISILNMGAIGNRRTASVKSVGYSDLFCLKKGALWDVLQDYPNARTRLEAIAVKRLHREDDGNKQTSEQQLKKQTVKPFLYNGCSQSSSHDRDVISLTPKHKIGNLTTGSRTVDAMQIPEVKADHSPSPSRKSSFLTSRLHQEHQRRMSDKQGVPSDLIKSSSNTSFHHNNEMISSSKAFNRLALESERPQFETST